VALHRFVSEQYLSRGGDKPFSFLSSRGIPLSSAQREALSSLLDDPAYRSGHAFLSDHEKKRRVKKVPTSSITSLKMAQEEARVVAEPLDTSLSSRREQPPLFIQTSETERQPVPVSPMEGGTLSDTKEKKKPRPITNRTFSRLSNVIHTPVRRREGAKEDEKFGFLSDITAYLKGYSSLQDVAQLEKEMKKAARNFPSSESLRPASSSPAPSPSPLLSSSSSISLLRQLRQRQKQADGSVKKDDDVLDLSPIFSSSDACSFAAALSLSAGDISSSEDEETWLGHSKTDNSRRQREHRQVIQREKEEEDYQAAKAALLLHKKRRRR